MKALSLAGLTTDEDVRWLAEHAAGRRIVIEIGPYEGRSTRALADVIAGTVYAIDDWSLSLDGRDPETTRAAFRRNCADLLASGKVVIIEQRSQSGLPELLEGLRVDMLWIDGDHSYDGLCRDLALYGPLVKPDGLICGHDYSVWHPEVVQAVDDVFGKSRVQTINIHRSIWWVTA